MKKQLWSAAACAMMILAGCSSASNGSSTASNASADSDTFTVGMECNYAPFNWQQVEGSDTAVELGGGAGYCDGYDVMISQDIAENLGKKLVVKKIPFNWQQVEGSDTAVELGGGAGYCDGYDVMISQDIAENLGKKLVVKKINWDGLQPALDSGEIDAIVAGMTANEEREEGIDFTTPYFSSEMVLIVPKGSELESFTDIQQFSGHKVIEEREEGIDFTTPYFSSEMVLIVPKGSELESFTDIQQFSGHKVIGQKNTNYDTVIDQIEGVNHVVPKSAYPELVLALQTGEAEAITAELPVAKGICEANPDLTYITFEEGKGFDIDTAVSIGLKNNSRDSEEFNAVQEALDKITQETREEYMQNAVNNAPTNE